MKDLVWTEKYRPTTLNDMVLEDSQREKIRNLLSKDIPNFLFVTKSPGTGKTTLAYIIKNELGCTGMDFKTMNASDERKIDSIREIKDFAMAKSSGKVRIVHMDEFDGVLGPSQDALRGIMEKYTSNCKFILTANSMSKIIDPIIDRCIVINLAEPPKEQVMERLMLINDKENVTIEPDALRKVINDYYPSMRGMVNKLQELASLGKTITIDMVKTNTEKADEFYKVLKLGSAYNARKYAIEHSLDPVDTFKQTIKNLMADEGLRDKLETSGFGWDVARLEANICQGSDKEIQFYAFMVRFIKWFK